MYVSLLFSFGVISLITLLLQVPAFIWSYRNFIKPIKIDYVTTSAYFIMAQLIIAAILFLLNMGFKVNLSGNISNFKEFTIFSILINISGIILLEILLNKLVFKIKATSNFFLVFILLTVIILAGPLLVFLLLNTVIDT